MEILTNALIDSNIWKGPLTMYMPLEEQKANSFSAPQNLYSQCLLEDRPFLILPWKRKITQIKHM